MTDIQIAVACNGSERPFTKLRKQQAALLMAGDVLFTARPMCANVCRNVYKFGEPRMLVPVDPWIVLSVHLVKSSSALRTHFSYYFLIRDQTRKSMLCASRGSRGVRRPCLSGADRPRSRPLRWLWTPPPAMALTIA